MKRHRHSAALLLAAAYLLMPPPEAVTNRFRIDFSAPLSTWAELRRFDSIAACERARKSYQRTPAGGQCVEHYGAGEVYLPLLQALGSLCRAGNGKPVVEALDRYAPTWLVQIPGVVTGAQFEDLQRRVQGTTQARMLRELAEALEAISADQLVIVVLEDLH